MRRSSLSAPAQRVFARRWRRKKPVWKLVVLERDSVPHGSTALSAGLIPAAGTRFQKLLGIDDSPALFAADLKRKAHDEADPAIVDLIAREAGRDD